MTRKHHLWVLLIICVLFFTACGQTDAPTTPQLPTLATLSEADQLKADFEVLLTFSDSDYFNMALTCTYTSAAELDLDAFFHNGFDGEIDNLTEEEEAFLQDLWGEETLLMNIHRLPVEKMDAVLKQYLGLGFAEMQGIGLEHMAFLPDTNCYYVSRSNTSALTHFTVTDVKAAEDTYQVTYTTFLGESYVVTLKSSADSFLIVSNVAAGTSK